VDERALRRAAWVWLSALLGLSVACGIKGPPRPPLVEAPPPPPSGASDAGTR